MPYRIVLSRTATKELARLPNKMHDRVLTQLRKLEVDPRGQGCEKLTGCDAYKRRVGDLRIVFEINDSSREVRVVMVDDRKQVYKKIRRKD
ncbi:MAG TPA: type II toxin-antitoxin system RelE/ParE family toxin [Pyrinomonadaceae bacterium]|nr:type II toxin-antitoxin system RelE/ParE family toxin [Pyrinomonadaceae bacterium]